MTTFEIKEEFMLDGEPFKILSGAIHYFRIHPDEWYHSLYNLKALGFNTVETYVPWNMHEKEEGTFTFTGFSDVVSFIQLAQEVGLYVILRPTPYICAEWEFGGLPAWLLEKNCRIRSSDPVFLTYVRRYYEELLEKVVPLQVTHGGPILMMQIENEYGSYGEDKDYLKAIKQIMEDCGVNVPFFTSDGSWLATLRAGSMVEEGVLPTGNFGSKGKANFAELKKFHESYHKKWPLMCMEFWDGWFNRWGEPIVTRETDELVEALKEVLEIGSVNLYMFHGGTNFGFMNGCSARGTRDLPQITSYDYGAPLDEQGNPTEKYYAIQKMVHEMFPEIVQMEPLIKTSFALENVPLTNKVSLVSVIDEISQKVTSKYPQTMEELGQAYGYLFYRTTLQKEMDNQRLRIIDGRDRAQVFVNGEHIATQYQEQIGEDLFVSLIDEENQLDILVENMSRVNYGHKLLAETQRKGIRQGVMSDLHFMLEWDHYCLSFDKPFTIDFSQEWQAGQPAFYQYRFTLEELADTFINLQEFGKGIVLVNGHHIGRFWHKGAQQSLYIPKGFLQKENEVIIFETEGKFAETLRFTKTPQYDLVETSLYER
ncbi:glycoside hydrolase family 35 protein [Enterococcus aquimarinus]|uniref:Beta-galactosidase n=1 Tax=Enterococcus aquimarinus TaxID=328396 RepID=A0A1L8QTV1_9ENTE|nr:beta-galactosidase family protein [Enterococcus aquimarinus]OJG10925.1 beta-galactosidase [Enterococcus aquimarinus]